MSVFVMNETEMHNLMGGHPAPTDATQRDAYFAIVERRILDLYGESALEHMNLLAGSAPESYANFCNERTRQNTLAMYKQS